MLIRQQTLSHQIRSLLSLAIFCSPPQEKSHQRPQILEKSDNKEQSGSRSNTASFMFFLLGIRFFFFVPEINLENAPERKSCFSQFLIQCLTIANKSKIKYCFISSKEHFPIPSCTIVDDQTLLYSQHSQLHKR